MAGSRSGVSTAILKEESKAVFTHCYGHSLQLAVCDTIKNIPNLNDALATVFEISKLIKFSPKRGTIFERLKEKLAPGTPGLRVLCPTCWTVRGAYLQSIIDNWNVLHEVWQASLEESPDTEVRARICGVLYQMSKSEFYFAVRVGALVLNVTDNLSKTLQHSHMTASEGQDIAKRVVNALKPCEMTEIGSYFGNMLIKEQKNRSSSCRAAKEKTQTIKV